MFDTNWHLARSEDDTQITNFELQLWQVFYAFLRWQEQCEQTIHSNNLTGYDLSILHMIRMKDKLKTIYDRAAQNIVAYGKTTSTNNN